MKIRTIALFLLLVVMAVFLVINWSAISAETTVNLVYTEIQAPLGIIVVCCFGVLILLMLLYTVWQAASVTLELRSAYKETRNA
ncbi:MAG: LapA family protein, partial [Sutterella sp.]